MIIYITNIYFQLQSDNASVFLYFNVTNIINTVQMITSMTSVFHSCNMKSHTCTSYHIIYTYRPRIYRMIKPRYCLLSQNRKNGPLTQMQLQLTWLYNTWEEPVILTSLSTAWVYTLAAGDIW